MDFAKRKLLKLEEINSLDNGQTVYVREHSDKWEGVCKVEVKESAGDKVITLIPEDKKGSNHNYSFSKFKGFDYLQIWVMEYTA